MKNTQKKLKRKHFRYLGKKEIANPMVYIDELFDDIIDIDWLKFDIAGFMKAVASSDPPIPHFGYGDAAERIKKILEVAYVFASYLPPPAISKLEKNLSKKEARMSWLSNHEGKIAWSLYRLFQFKTLKTWRELIDKLLMNITDDVKYLDLAHIADEIILIHDHLLQLADTMHHIYEAKGLPIELPDFIIPKHKSY